MMNLKDYQERKDLLGGWYDRVIEADELLQSDVDALRESKCNLYGGRFVVAICGGMNSGKSTLLNGLLFEDEVLPSHITTTTAKIALMEGDATERIEATLYTPDEFQRVKDACSSDLEKSELDEARETAGANGLKESDLLTEPAHVRSEDGLRGLAKFAAVCSRGGIYSVYVKSVRLWADRRWLHQVTVADTPGTDDPNHERDKITLEWIHQADAVVYVTFAGQAGVNEQDVKFIDKYLAHIDPSRRILAVNKCDQESNTEAIWNNIRKIRNGDDLRKKNLFGDDDQIVLVSGLGALISSMQHAGRQISDDMKWYAEKMSATGYLEPELHGLEKLRALVERRIIATRGDGIIQAHQRRLESVFERAITRLSQDEAVLKNNIDAVNASKADRAKERKKVSESITSISSHIRDSRIEFEKKLDESHSILDEKINGVSEKVSRTITDTIANVRQIDNLAGQARWGLQDGLYKERTTLAEAIRVLVNQIETVLNNAENQLSDVLLTSDLGARVPLTHLLPVTARTICKDAEDLLIEHLDREFLKEVVDEATIWWQRIFNTKAGRRDAVEGLMPEMEGILREALETIPGQTRRELVKLGQDAIQSMENSCREILERRLKLLDELEKGDLVDDAQEMQLTNELREVEKRRLQIENLQSEYQGEVTT